MYSKIFLLPVSFCVIACHTKSSTNRDTAGNVITVSIKASVNPYHSIEAIPLPAGYRRTNEDSSSFGNWLRNISLKKDKTVYLFNGEMKVNQTAQFAVLDISTGDKNLQQCADAVMRLRAEYLFATGQYDKIVFTDNEGGHYQLTQPYSKEHLLAYLQTVFGMCGSASLSKQLKHTEINEIKPGDVLIRGGFPGHAVIIMDVAVNKEGKKCTCWHRVICLHRISMYW